MPALRFSSSLLPLRGTTIRTIPGIPSYQTARPMCLTSVRHQTSHPNPQRDAQKDREKINTDANEYAKSGTDDTAAHNPDAAFDPNITDPQEAKKKAGEGNKVNPLDASPANPELSQGTRESTGERKKGEVS